jgi:hypothetical protein
MAFVFRVHDQGQSHEDWFESSRISEADIDNIESALTNTREEALPTSVPSPFARIFLVSEAFSSVSNGNIDGESDKHFLVSRSLDIAELLFYADRFPDKLDLIQWELNSGLEKLKRLSPKLGKTLKVVWDQDFGNAKFDEFVIVRFNHQVVGGTSPLTCFFSANLNGEILNIAVGNYNLFGKTPVPLHKRNPGFIKYYCHLIESLKQKEEHSDHHHLFKYLDENIKLLKNRNSVIDDSTVSYSNLLGLNFTGQNMNEASVLGISLKKEKSDSETIYSDFLLSSFKNFEGPSPLVIPNSPYSGSGKNYFEDTDWSNDFLAPFEVKDNIESRILPGINQKYPFLTGGDFFEETLIETVDELDRSRFHTIGNGKYLLPLKTKFFDLFSNDDLLKGKVMFEAESFPGSAVKVKLEIPTKGAGNITFEKTYRKSLRIQPGGVDGIIIEKIFALVFFPFRKPLDFGPGIYVGLTGRPNLEESGIKFFNEKNSIVKPMAQKDFSSPIDLSLLNVKQPYDYIQFTTKVGNGLIIPKFPKESNGRNSIRYSVDFGTTKTHISKRDDESQEVQDFYSHKDLQRFLYEPNKVKNSFIKNFYDYIFPENLIPFFIGKDPEFSFPIRSVLIEHRDTNYNETLTPYHETKIGFLYGKKAYKKELNLKPNFNLKWDTQDSFNEFKIRQFIQELLILVWYDVYLNEGRHQSTELIWSFPASMPLGQRNSLEKIWKEGFVQLFGAPETSLKSITESEAPYFYYHQNHAIGTQNQSALSLDFGGGTVDAVLVKNDKPKYITSYQFGGDYLFGDGFGGSFNFNGFVQYFKSKYATGDIQIPKEFSSENSIFVGLKNSTEYINFLFSISDIIKQKGLNHPFDFQRDVCTDKKFKIVLAIYFAANFFYINNFLKGLEESVPKYFFFSGSLSKLLNSFDSDLFEEIFKWFVLNPSQIMVKDVELKKPEYEPKKLTSIGGLYVEKFDFKSENRFWMGSSGNPKQEIFEPFRNDLKLEDIKSNVDLKRSIIDSAENFLKSFIKFIETQGIETQFGFHPSVMDRIKGIGTRSLLKEGLDQGLERMSLGTNLSQSLFFLPVIHLIYHLASEISNDDI